MIKREIGLLLFVVALALIFSSFSVAVTGNAVGVSFVGERNMLPYFGVVMLAASLLLLAAQKSLDAIIIPTGPSRKVDRQRTERAVKEYDSLGGEPYMIISGAPSEPLRESQRYGIYSVLREHDIRPGQMRTEKGHSRNTFENAKYSLERASEMGWKKIGIATDMKQIARFAKVVDVGKKEGKIASDVAVYAVSTDESAGSRLYELAAKVAYSKKNIRKAWRGESETVAPKWVGVPKKILGAIYRWIGRK